MIRRHGSSQGGFFVSCPYPEGAARSIARAAFAQNDLAGVATIDVKSRLRLRSASPQWPQKPRARLCTEFELLRLAAAYAKQARVASIIMYREHESFDTRVANRGSLYKNARVVLGLPGACAATFKAAGRFGPTRVLHCVNSLPSVQNDLIRIHHPEAPNHELVPMKTLQRVERELLLADSLLAPSEFIAAQLIAAGVEASKINVAPYGVDLEFFARRTPRLYDDKRALKALFVGQISYRKGVSELIAAARILGSDIEITMAGPVVSPELLKDLPMNVHYRGGLPRSGVREALWATDVFTLPSLEDACPLVIFEALAAGLPIVTTDKTGNADMLPPGCSVVVPAGDATALAVGLGAWRSAAAQRSAREQSLTFLEGNTWNDYGPKIARLYS